MNLFVNTTTWVYGTLVGIFCVLSLNVNGQVNFSSLIPPTTKWVIIFDGERFGASKIGKDLLKRWMARELDRKEDQLLHELGFQVRWRTIKKIFLLGKQFPLNQPPSGVLIVWSEIDLTQALRDKVKKNKRGELIILQEKDTPYELYIVETNLYIAPIAYGIIAIGTNKSDIEEVVVRSREKALQCAEKLYIISTVEKAQEFILLVVVDNLDKIHGYLFQKIVRGKAILNEEGDFVTINLEIECIDKTIAQSFQQVLIGARALTKIVDFKHKWVQFLAESLEVVSEGNNVIIQGKIPVSNLSQLFDQLH